MAWWQKKDPVRQQMILTTRALDSRNLQLIKTTLSMTRLPQDWRLQPRATEGVVLVDVDDEEGKRLWRQLLTKGRYYRVVPVTRDGQLQRLANGLAKPLRAKPLEDFLRATGEALNAEPGAVITNESAVGNLLLCEAIVQSPHERFGIHMPDGHWFYVERDKDRLFAGGGLENLLDSLFLPMRSIAIKPLKLRPESFASGTASESYSLSLMLWSAAQSHEAVSQLKVLRGNGYFSLRHPMAWSKLPHQADQRVLMDYLQAHGPLDLMSLILEVGMAPQRVMAVIAGAWLLGAVKAALPQAVRSQPAG